VKDGHNFDEKLVTKVKNKIRENLSARHVPALVLEISEIPVSIQIRFNNSIN
jgi:hypothetical protein